MAAIPLFVGTLDLVSNTSLF